MRKTQLFIKVNNAWKEIDLFDDIVVPITMKVTDIRQFGSKTSSYSLDFDIPHTNNNAQVFGLNSEIDVYESTFEVGKDYPAYMTNDTFTVFDGQFRLKKVIKKNNGTYIYYVGYLYGGAKNFVDALGTDKLVGNDDPSKDLNFSEYAVTANEMTLQDFYYYLQSRDTAGGGWGLTLLDKTNKAAQAFSGGSQQWYTDECTPYLYAREIFDKLFPSTGYTYVSEFMQGTDFSTYIHDPRWANGIGKYDVNSLIYPYMRHNSNIHSARDISSRVVEIDSNSTTAAVSAVVPSGYNFDDFDIIAYNLDFDSTYYNLFETNATSTLTDYIFTATETGTYHIDINFPFKVNMNMYIQGSQGRYMRTGETLHTNTNDNHPFTVWVQAVKNGSTMIGSRTLIREVYAGGYTSQDNSGLITIAEDTFSYSADLYLNIGETISVYTWIEIPLYYTVSGVRTGSFFTNETISRLILPTNIKLQITHNPDTSDIISIHNLSGFYEEASFNPTMILNPKTSKVDFFNMFVKMFNLYVEDVSGKTDYKTGGIYAPNTLRIEPYEIFYAPELGGGQSNVKDWTDKIDWESVEYRRCDDYLYNIQSFTKKQDKDFYNDNYDSTYVTPYGNREVKGVYCTANDKNEIGLNVSANLCGIVNNATDVLQCPKVFALDKSGNIDTKKEYSDGIFFIWRNYMNANTDLTTNYTLKLQSRLRSGSGSYYNMTNYFCADTLNKGYGADDANLNWGGTETYYQNMKGTIPTYNDLYNAFYAKEYDEKTAPDATIMRANAYLTAQDIYNLQLSDMIICNGNYWHILEVNQWKDEKTPCQIELIKTRPSTTPLTMRPKPPVLIDPPMLPIATDNATLLQQLSQLTEELRDTNDRLNNANEQIGELEEQLSAIPADILNPNTTNEHKIPLRIVFNDQAVGERKVVSAEVSEQMYNALRSGSWNASTVSKRGDNATIVLDRTSNRVVPEYIRGTATVNLDTMCKPMYERKANANASKPNKSNTTVSNCYAIPGSKKVKPNNVKAKNGMYAASWQHTYT